MKQNVISVAFIAAIIVFLFIPGTVGQPPQPPCWFYGTVSFSGLPAQDGQNITALIRGTNLNWTTQTKNGTYGWPQRGSISFYVPYDNSSTLLKDGGEDGDTIDFYINGDKTSQSATYQSIETIRADLSIGSPLDLTPPSIVIVTPENKTYSQSSIELVFTVNETATWIAYRLDDRTNQTISGNQTLSDLPTGSHRIIVYARDAVGNEGVSEQVFFSVGINSQEPLPLWMIAAVFSVALAGIGALSFFLIRRFKQKQDQ